MDNVIKIRLFFYKNYIDILLRKINIKMTNFN